MFVTMPEDGTDREGRGALEQVFAERYGSLVALARVLADRREDAEEIVMEAFARTLAATRGSDLADDAHAYVRRVVVNLSRSRLRHLYVIRRHAPALLAEAAAREAVASSATRRLEIVAAVAALPKRQRECVALRYLEDCSTVETAAALGITEGSVKTHLHRALATLEKTLGGER